MWRTLGSGVLVGCVGCGGAMQRSAVVSSKKPAPELLAVAPREKNDSKPPSPPDRAVTVLPATVPAVAPAQHSEPPPAQSVLAQPALPSLGVPRTADPVPPMPVPVAPPRITPTQPVPLGPPAMPTPGIPQVAAPVPTAAPPTIYTPAPQPGTPGAEFVQDVMLIPRWVYVPYAPQTPTGPARMTLVAPPGAPGSASVKSAGPREQAGNATVGSPAPADPVPDRLIDSLERTAKIVEAMDKRLRDIEARQSGK